MKLPEELELKILSELHMDGLYNTPARYEKEIKKLKTEMINLSFKFTLRQLTAPEYSDAYFCYNFPQNFMKSMTVAKKLFKFYKIEIPNKLSILDIGCGEGAGMFGLYKFLSIYKPECKFSLIGVDSNNSLLKRCRKIADWFKGINSGVEIEIIKEDALKFVRSNIEHFDFIILSNSLVEISRSRSIPLHFVHSLLKHLRNSGFIIIIEPALKNLARRLMELHDFIIKNKVCSILLPCIHNNKCPALIKKREWCHQSIKWEPPEYMKIINRYLYRKIEYLKFSYLVLSNHNYEPSFSNAFLVISRMFKEKGRNRCLICTQNGIIELIRLDREKSSINQEFDRVSIGDVLEISGAVKINPGLIKINKETGVKRLDF